MQAADRARAYDHYVVTGLDAGELLAVDHAGERLGDGGLREADTGRDAIDAASREDSGRDAQVPGERAVVVVAEGFPVTAHAVVTLTTVAAPAAADRGRYLNPVARSPLVRVLAGLGDFPGDLMSQNARRLEAVAAVRDDLQVGAAQRAGPDPDRDLAASRHRLWRVLEPQVAGAIKAGDSHQRPLSSSMTGANCSAKAAFTLKYEMPRLSRRRSSSSAICRGSPRRT